MDPETFVMPVTVRYSEVDAQGVVFNMWYLGWFDEAFTAFLAHRGVPYRTMLDAGYDVQVVHTELDYRSGARWEDDVAVHVTMGPLGRTSFTIRFAVHRDGTDIVTGSTVYVVVAADGSGKREIPEFVAAALG